MSNDPTAGLTGLEALRQMIAGHLPAPSMAETMGLSLERVDEGYALFHARADTRHLNPLGMVHGGFASTALDSATGCAVHTTLEPGVGYATVNLEVKMLKLVPRDTLLFAESRVIHGSKRVGVAEGTLRDAEGTLYAQGSAICMIFR